MLLYKNVDKNDFYHIGEHHKPQIGVWHNQSSVMHTAITKQILFLFFWCGASKMSFHDESAITVSEDANDLQNTV